MSTFFPEISVPSPVGMIRAMSEMDDEKSQTVFESYGDQNLFSSWKAKCIERTTDYLGKLRISEAIPPNFCSQLILNLGVERGKIAQEMQTKNADKFGVHRCDPEWNEQITFTHLTDPLYAEINQRMRSLFFAFFPMLDEGQNRCTIKTPSSLYIFERIDEKKLAGMLAKKEIDLYLLNSIATVHRAVNTLYPDLNTPSFPQLGNLQFLVGSVYYNFGDQWSLLTRHVSWINQSEPGPLRDSTVEFFKNNVFASFIQTPRENIDLCLNRVDQLARPLIEKNYENADEFKRDLVEWEFLLFHTMPFLRGSCTVGEILRDSFCKLHNQPIPATKDTDAMAQPFLESYSKSR